MAAASDARDGADAPAHPRALSILVGVLLAYVLVWNITTVSTLRLPLPIAHVGTLLGISQVWDMFAPSPLGDDGWYVMPGTLGVGRVVDVAGVLRDDESLRAVSWRKPADIRATYKDEHWRKYLEVLRLRHPGQHLYLSRYICRQWNDHHGGGHRLVKLAIGYMGKSTLPKETRPPPALRTLEVHGCQ